MSNIRLILGDQLSSSISSLKDYKPETDIILMCEVWDEATYVKHHKKKIAFIFSAMRHFAQMLKKQGFTVEYIPLDDPNNTGSLCGEVKRMLSQYNANRIIVTHPSEYRVLEDIRRLKKQMGYCIRDQRG